MFKNNNFNDNLGGKPDSKRTQASCTEQFIKTNNLPLRAVMCVRAYRKFEGLYDFTLLTASTNNSRASLQSRIDVTGVSYENGLRSTRSFLEALSSGRTK